MAAEDGGAGRAPAVPVESPATVGLLTYLSGHALDDDYRAVATRTGSVSGPASRHRAGWTIAVLAVFVVLLMTAATQTSRNAVADEDQRKDLITQIRQRKAAVQADTTRIDRLQGQVAALRARLLDSNKLSDGTRDQLQLLSVRAGVVPVRGPGVVVTVDDAPGAASDRSTVLDSDLQVLVNGLWQAGAEAITINGQRLTNLSAIRQAGSAITVNFDRLDRPYVVQAVGDPAELPRRFGDTASGQTWLDLQQRIGLEFSMRTRTKMSLPGAGIPTLRQARPPRTGNEVKEGTS